MTKSYGLFGGVGVVVVVLLSSGCSRSGEGPSDSCTTDPSSCAVCGTDPAIVSCGVAPISEQPVAFVLAANDAEVGLVTATAGHAASPPRARFTRLSAKLDVLSTTLIEDPLVKWTFDDGSFDDPRVYVAPAPSGWYVALSSRSDFVVHTLDAKGAEVARLPVTSLGGGGYLLPRSGGGPLAVWQSHVGDQNEVVYNVSVIAADGRSMTPPATVMTDVHVDGMGSGTFLDGAFYLPAYLEDGRIKIARIDPDGAISEFMAPTDRAARWPALIAGDHELHLIASAGEDEEGRPIAIWQRMSVTGAATAAPSLVDLTGSWAGSPLAVGGDAVSVVLSDQHQSLDLLRLDAGGRVLRRMEVAQARPDGFTAVEATARGPDVVLGWFVYGTQISAWPASPPDATAPIHCTHPMVISRRRDRRRGVEGVGLRIPGPLRSSIAPIQW